MSDALPAGTVLGDYTILRVLGQGGFGVTYLAHDAGLDQDVVLKENLPTQFAGRGGDSLTVTSRGGRDGADNFEWATRRFLDEARLLARLSHPNIVRVLRAFSALGTAYYVMPWVGGKDLKQFAAACGGVDEAFLRGVLSKLLPALSYLHSNNLLHRDIKPANILCADDGTPILIDFGTARALVSERSQTMVESAGYTPMEQIQSHGNTGPWTDLYALGATLYTLVTGEHPPRSSDRIGKTDCYVPLAGRAELKDNKYGAGFLESVDKALAVWPEDRWQSADEWKSALLRSSVSSPPPPDSQGGELPREGKKGNGLRLAFLLLALALIWGGYFMYRYNGPRHVKLSGQEETFYTPDPIPEPEEHAEIGSTEWLRQRAEKEEPDAQFQLAEHYRNLMDRPAAVEWYRKAAEHGHREAQYQLAVCYEKGFDATKGKEDAVPLYRAAAVQGHAAAQYAFGYCCAHAIGMPSADEAEAASWYKMAADQGNANAQFELGYCYAHGSGVQKDMSEAAEWYLKAAEQGNVQAQVNLALCYSRGDGVPTSPPNAVKWYKRAADQGNTNAQFSLGYCYAHGSGVQKDMSEAAEWYLKAAEQGNVQAQVNLALCYSRGDGVPASPPNAAKWYRKAADQGNANAQFELGRMYEQGEGVSKNIDEAGKWYEKSAGRGNSKAANALQRINYRRSLASQSTPSEPEAARPASIVAVADEAAYRVHLREKLNVKTEVLHILQDVSNFDTANAAAPKVSALISKLRELDEKEMRMSKPAEASRRAIDAEYREDARDVASNLEDVLLELLSNQCYSSGNLMTILTSLTDPANGI